MRHMLAHETVHTFWTKVSTMLYGRRMTSRVGEL